MDITMPRMDGMETLRAMRRIAPGVPVVLTSGYGASTVKDSAIESGAVPDAVLPKPYGVDPLLATLRRVMR
jgi:CheY-like chemotaxis protein